MKPALDDMLVFLNVVDTRTFTAAAERLGRTKSAISQSITRLENDLGERLLYRSTRALSLTEAGSAFYLHCQDINQSYQAAIDEVKSGDRLSGVLTVTAPHALSESLLVPVMAQYSQQYPEMRIRFIAEDLPMDIVGAQIDLAIRVGRLELQSAKVSKLGDLEESLYASRAYVTSKGGMPSDLMTLAKWEHIANEWQGSPIRYPLSSDKILRAVPKIRCNSLQDILQLVRLNSGVARLPDAIAYPHLRQGTLMRLAAVGSSPIHYLHLFAGNPPKKVQSFVELMRKHLHHPVA